MDVRSWMQVVTRRRGAPLADALEHNPRLLEALMGRAAAEQARNQPEAAQLTLRAALDLGAPEAFDAYAHARLAMVLNRMDRFDEAERHADLARDIAAPRGSS